MAVASLMVHCCFSAPVVLICTLCSPAELTVEVYYVSKILECGQHSIFVLIGIHAAFSVSGHTRIS
jgi:hypothetical protein